VAIAVSDALSHAHGKGVVHRDIKPGNIMVWSEDDTRAAQRIKVMDFGLAKLAGSAKFTRTATVMGTLAYMSPEQARGETVDHCTDIFSLGALLRLPATMRRPYFTASSTRRRFRCPRNGPTFRQIWRG
jgi:serine/threonine protein kinase